MASTLTTDATTTGTANATTTPVAEAIHNHHEEILSTLRGHVAAIASGDDQADPAALVAFLKNDLMPHAQGEEAYLYPAVDPLVKAHGKATATMMVDHEFITGYIARIEEATRVLNSSAADEESVRSATLAALQRLSLQLEAVLALHLEKEERVYIPLFEKYLPAEEQQRVLDGMHEAYGNEDEKTATNTGTGTGTASEQVLDVRAIPPRGRHELIFSTFEDLKVGEAFVLVNDHDPKPLYYQFSAELEGQFTWDYLERGPEEWRVRIGRA